MIRIEHDMQTGETRDVPLTEDEIAENAARAVAEQAREAERDLRMKRAAALRALDDRRLELAAIDPAAPQAVKDYAALLKA